MTVYSLKQFKEIKQLSEETVCFSANIYCDNKKVGYCSNRGIGGCNEIVFSQGKDYLVFEDYVKNIPPVNSMKMDPDLFISLLVEQTSLEKYEKSLIKRLLKKGAIIIAKVQKHNRWDYYGLKTTEALANLTTREKGNELVVIHR
jgi:hypothetical protein